MTKKIISLLFILFADFIHSQITPCANADFEAVPSGSVLTTNQIAGYKFSNQSAWSCNFPYDSLPSVISSEVINAPSGYIDSNIGSIYPIYSVYGGTLQNNGNTNNPSLGNMYGNNFIRIGSSNMTQSTESMTRKFKVDSLNWMHKFAYMFVTVPGMPGVHNCCTHPMLKVIVTNLTTNQMINYRCQYTYLYNPSVLFPCTFLPNTLDTFYYKGTFTTPPPTSFPTAFTPYFTKWQIKNLDLLAFKGDSVRIDFIVSKCKDCGHFGYGYIDSQCFVGNLYANNVLNTTGTFTACTNATLSTVPGYTYSWNGPNVNNVSTQSIVVNSSGTYSLNIYNNQNLVSIQTISVTINTPVPIQVSSICDTICKNMSCLLSIPPNMNPYQWNSGSQTFTTIVTPTLTTLYYVQAIDSNGCAVLAYKIIVVKECTGLPDLNSDENFKVYPNPTTDHLFLESNNLTINSVTITDLLGKSIPIKISLDRTQKIDLADFPQGIYFLKVKNANANKTFKIIKN